MYWELQYASKSKKRKGNQMKKLMVMFLVALFAAVINVAIAQDDDSMSSDEAKAVLFVGSKANNVYHKADCPAVNDIADEDRQDFASEEEAIDAGMTIADCCKSEEEADVIKVCLGFFLDYAVKGEKDEKFI